jgi:hypothetical protein
MTAHTRARYCQTAATLSAAAGLYAATVQLALGVPGAIAALVLWLAACSYENQHLAELLAHEEARRAAIAIPDPRPMPEWEQIDEQTRYDETFDDMISHWNEEAA